MDDEQRLREGIEALLAESESYVVPWASRLRTLLDPNRRKFQINPGPLKRTGPRVQEEYVTDTPCEATLKSGLPCFNRATYEVGGRHLCDVHRKTNPLPGQERP